MRRWSDVVFPAVLLAVALRVGVAAELLKPLPPEPEVKRGPDAWWTEQPFAVVYHFGLYSMVGGEWKGARSDESGERVRESLRIPVGEYEMLANAFDPKKFDAKEWARAARKAGATCVMLAVRDADGFSLWDTKAGPRAEFDVVNTPLKKDVAKELSQACRDEGVRFGVYYPLEDWDARLSVDDARAQLRELLKDYGDVGAVWVVADPKRRIDEANRRELQAFCKTLKPDVVVLEDGVPEMTINDSRGWRKADENWKRSDAMVRGLVSAAAAGRPFVLHVGPNEEGRLRSAQTDRMNQLGDWLKANGDSVFATAGGPKTSIEEAKATRSGNTVYVHFLTYPDEPTITIDGVGGGPVARAYLTSAKKDLLLFSQKGQRVTVHLPEKKDQDEKVRVLAVEFDAIK